MLEFTTAFRTELKRLREQPDASTSPIRLTRNRNGTLSLEFDQVHDNDVTIETERGGPRVLIAQDLANQLDGAIVHFRDAAGDIYGDSSIVVLGHRTGTPRPQWAPPTTPARSRTPVWMRVRRQLGATSAPASASQTAGL